MSSNTMALHIPHNGLSPTSGNTYVVNNYGTLNVLGDFDASLEDGTPIIASAAGTNDISQIWTYLTYPASDGSTVFTLQALSTSQAEPLFVDRAGYMRVDTTSNKIVQGGAPLAWKLIEVNSSVFQIVPWDSAISKGGYLLTDVNSVQSTDSDDSAANQAVIGPNYETPEQLWFFTNP